MNKIFIVLIVLFCTKIYASEWTPIAPMPYCPQFIVEFRLQGNYEIRYKPFEQEEEYRRIKNIININDLSSVTDELYDVAQNYCSLEYTVTIGTDQILCLRDLGAKPFSDEYTNMLEDIITALDMTKNNCEDVIPLIELQNDLVNLDQDRVLDFKGSGSFFKLFTGDVTDELIDHFFECGGKKGSQQFIENMILLEAKNACVFPAPPGLLNFEKSKEIAQRIAKEYPNLSLLKTNSKQDGIAKAAILEFTDVVLNEQLKSLLGPDIDTTKLVSELDTYKKIKREKDSRVIDHLSFITSVEAPIELVEKNLDLLVYHNYASILPQGLSEEEKRGYLDENVIPTIRERINTCLAPVKERIGYPSTGKTKKVIKARKRMQEEFCQTNPENCSATGCGGTKKNILTSRADVGDLELLQGCVFDGISQSLEPMFNIVIDGQKDLIKDTLELTDAEFSQFKTEAYEDLRSCADTKLKTTAGMNYPENFIENPEVLNFVDVADYKSAILDCAKETENNLTNNVVRLTIGKMSIIDQYFGNGKKVTVLGKTIDEGSDQFAQEILDKVLPECNQKQSVRVYNNNELSSSSINCRALIEMEAARAIIDKSIKETLEKYNITDESIINDFHSCTNGAKYEAVDSLLNDRATYPIMNSKDAENYLKNNNVFYLCLSTAITESADKISDVVIDNLIEEQKEKLSDPDFLIGMKPRIKEKVNECFKAKLDEIGNWPNFLAYNEEGGLTQMQSDCEAQATEFVLPQIISNESARQIAGITNINLINEDQAEAIQGNIALTLQQKYNIQVPNNPPRPRNNFIIEQAYKKFLTNYNGEDPLNDFIKDFTATAQLTTIETIKTNIVDEVVRISKPGFIFDELKEELPTQCLNQLYEQNKENIAHMIELSKENKTQQSTKKDLRAIFIDILQKGLIRSQIRGRYDDLLGKIKKLCQNPSDYSDLSKLVETGIADDFIVSVVEKKVHEAFSEVIHNQCYEGLDKYGLNLLDSDKEKICTYKFSDYTERSRYLKELSKNIDDPFKVSMLDLVLNRRVESQSVIALKLNSKSFMDKVFLEDRDVLNKIYQNFDKVVFEDPDLLGEINLLAMDKIFKDRSKNSFAEKFIETQLIAGVGEAGYSIAEAKVEEELSDLPWYQKPFNGSIRRNAKKSFQNRWKYTGVKHYLAFDKTDEAKRQEMMDVVFQNAIKPRMDVNATEEQNAAKLAALTVYMESHMDDNRVYNNPDYRPARTEWRTNYPVNIPEKGPRKFNFSEKFAYDITQDVKSGVWDDIKESAKEGLKRSFTSPVYYPGYYPLSF